MKLRLIALAATISAVCASLADAQRPSALKGSRTKLTEQNSIANAYNLDRMEDAAMVDRMTANGFLVEVPSRGTGWYLDPNMSSGYPYPEKLRRARPWVLELINREGRNFSAALPGSQTKISSLVRTEAFQRQLQRHNPNAALCETPLTCSPHLTGSAFDISKLDMTAAELSWWRKRLVALQKCGQIIANEEWATNSFHVFVHPKFATKKCG
jgi:hypothetical protein